MPTIKNAGKITAGRINAEGLTNDPHFPGLFASFNQLKKCPFCGGGKCKLINWKKRKGI